MPNKNMLQVESRVDKNIGYLEIAGQLLAESRFALDSLLRDWNDADVNRVIISCQMLDYIDSAGLSTLIGALHRMRRAGGEMVLTDINPKLDALFELSSMRTYLHICDDMNDATRLMKSIKAARRKKGSMGQIAARARESSRTKPRTKIRIK